MCVFVLSSSLHYFQFKVKPCYCLSLSLDHGYHGVICVIVSRHALKEQAVSHLPETPVSSNSSGSVFVTSHLAVADENDQSAVSDGAVIAL